MGTHTATQGAGSAADDMVGQGTPHEEMARLQQVSSLDTHCSDVFRKLIELVPKHDLNEQEDNHDATVDAVCLCAAIDAVCCN